ncbi:MAG: GYD domain-containing protein [Chloroflexota bacterium]|nr:GYD domain-containing protein [Chloroflexota bacterium]
MATFIMLSTLTDEGASTIKSDPNRITEVNQELEKMGVKVLSQYAVLGPYDFVNVVEAKDNVAIARVSAVLSARGSIRLLTMPAIPIDEFISGLASQ